MSHSLGQKKDQKRDFVFFLYLMLVCSFMGSTDDFFLFRVLYHNRGGGGGGRAGLMETLSTGAEKQDCVVGMIGGGVDALPHDCSAWLRVPTASAGGRTCTGCKTPRMLGRKNGSRMIRRSRGMTHPMMVHAFRSGSSTMMTLSGVFLVVSCLAWPGLALPCLALHCLVWLGLACLALPCLAWPGLALSGLILSFLFCRACLVPLSPLVSSLVSIF